LSPFTKTNLIIHKRQVIIVGYLNDRLSCVLLYLTTLRAATGISGEGWGPYWHCQ